jgi:DNA modification methylase
MLGVDGKTVASVRAELESTAEIPQLNRTIGLDGKHRPVARAAKVVDRPAVERKARLDALTLIHGDCRKELKKIATASIDVVLSDPIYPGVDREYGTITEDRWHSLMQDVVRECRRILKPRGSAVFILQPNFEKVGRMRLWIYDFVAWAGRELGLIQDCYWWAVNSLPTRSTYRSIGLLRQSIKWCVWLGPPNCYRNQDGVLWEVSDAMASVRWSDRCLRNSPSGHTVRRGRVVATANERGGVTPFNILPAPSTHPGDHIGHPASTPYEVAAWWCRYVLPVGGVLLDPFVGSGTMLAAGLANGASRVIGIDTEKKYLAMARRKVLGV